MKEIGAQKLSLHMKTHVWDKEKSQVRLFFIELRPVFAVWNSAVDNNALYADLLFFLTEEDWIKMQFVHWLVTIETNHQKNPSAILINAKDTEEQQSQVSLLLVCDRTCSP